MSNPLPSMPPGRPTVIPVDGPSSTWDRITSWVSENKAVVYTIAGVAVVVTGAGVVYYLNSDSVRRLAPPPGAACHRADPPSLLESKGRVGAQAQQEGEAEAERG